MKPTNRMKSPELATRSDMERTLHDYAVVSNEHHKLAAALDAELIVTRSRYADRISAKATRLEELHLQLRDWAERNPEEFGKLKSLETCHGTIGFRIGNPTVKPGPKMTWEKVKDRLRELGESMRQRYLRVTEDVNKVALLEDREVVDLTAVGVRVVQEETFYVASKQVTSPTASSSVVVTGLN